MSFWSLDAHGSAFPLKKNLMWGDEPAEEITKALNEIFAIHYQEQGALPTEDELLTYLSLSLDNDLEVPKSARVLRSAVKRVHACFRKEFKREVNPRELLAGFEFSLTTYEAMCLNFFDAQDAQGRQRAQDLGIV